MELATGSWCAPYNGCTSCIGAGHRLMPLVLVEHNRGRKVEDTRLVYDLRLRPQIAPQHFLSFCSACQPLACWTSRLLPATPCGTVREFARPSWSLGPHAVGNSSRALDRPNLPSRPSHHTLPGGRHFAPIPPLLSLSVCFMADEQETRNAQQPGHRSRYQAAGPRIRVDESIILFHLR